MTRSPVRIPWSWLWMMAPVLLLGGMAYANAAPPRRPPPKPEGPFLKIEQIPGLERARLVVPRKLMTIDDKGKEKADAGITPDRTAIAGVAMSAAVGLLGLQFIRRRTGRPAALLLACGIGMTVLSAAALADIAIPGQPRRERPRPPEPPLVLPAGVPVTIEVVARGDEVVLQIAPEQLREPKPDAPRPDAGPGDAPGNAPLPPGAAPGNAPSSVDAPPPAVAPRNQP